MILFCLGRYLFGVGIHEEPDLKLDNPERHFTVL